MQRILVTLGLVLLVLGLAWPLLQKLGLGQLPGDISVKRDHFSFYFPLTTSIIISIIVTLIIWLFRK